jgi:hypothetical protein
MSQHYDALMSYTRFDDQHHQQYLTTFREHLSGEVQAHTGKPFRIFQDIEDIKAGQQFKQRIDHALDTITFFIPILTPSFFTSDFCRYELEKFLAREQELGRSDLVLPVYFVRVPALENPALRDNDPLAQTLAARQYIDWRKLRFKPLTDPAVHEMLAQMAEQIADALVESAEQKHHEAEEEEQRRREAEAAEQKRREAEEQERQRQQAEQEQEQEQERREAEEQERQHREAEEQERQRRAAEEQERLRQRREAEAAERKRQRQETEEQKRQRREAEAAEQERHEAEEQERKRETNVQQQRQSEQEVVQSEVPKSSGCQIWFWIILVSAVLYYLMIAL